MVVIGKLEAGLVDFFGSLVHEFGDPFPIVQRMTVLLINPGQNDIFVTNDVRILKHLG